MTTTLTHVTALLSVLLSAAGAAEPFLLDAKAKQPRVVATASGAAVAYAVDKTIVVRTTTDGLAWSDPTVVASVPGMPVGMRRGPQIAATAAGLVVAAIGESGDIRVWTQRDGKQWQGPKVINDVPKAAREGLFSLAGSGKSVWCAWLDLRGGKTVVMASRSADSGLSWSPNSAVYEAPSGSVCECCQPMVAADGARVAVMWRNHIGGDRDMWLRIGDGKAWRDPVKLGTGSWTLNACPMDGGGVAMAGEAVQTVWRRDSVVYACTPGQPELELGAGKNASVAIAAGTAYRAWQRGERIVLAKEGGQPVDVAAGFYPTLAAPTIDGATRALIAWEATEGARVALVDIK